jgi:hypothetical protein
MEMIESRKESIEKTFSNQRNARKLAEIIFR